MTELKVPPVSISMEEARVLRWLVADGSEVAAGQAVVEIESDKATVEVEAPAAGRLEIVAPADSVVDAAGVLARIRGEHERRGAPEASAEPRPSKPRLRRAAVTTPARDELSSPRASPAAKRLARERGIPLDGIRGTGPEGRITLADLEASLTTRSGGDRS